MRVAIVFAYRDYHRRGRRNRMSMQPQIGTLLAGLLPDSVEVDIVNETWESPDWNQSYDLVFISAMHSDFDRARQLSHYWRRRGAKTVFGGYLAASHPDLCQPWFDALVTGDPEANIPQLYQDFLNNAIQPRYHLREYDADTIRVPRFDLLAGKARHPFALEATRGCPYTCEFCVLTGFGTRHHTRDVADVIRDIQAGQCQLAGKIPDFQRKIVGFTDNNLAGHPAWFRQFCDAIEPLGLQWYAAVTFNIISKPDLVERMAKAGCRVVFVGLESFNPATLKDMHKHQNAAHKVKAALAACRTAGILVISGMMVSPLVDDIPYLRRLPEYLAESGLIVPTFLCFESPIPGTPHFLRLAAESHPAFLSNALLEDFSGYTLTVRPRHAAAEEFVAAYVAAVKEVFSWGNRLKKIAHDVPRLFQSGGWFPAAVDMADMLTLQNNYKATKDRTWLAGTDIPYPEIVPFDDSDFDNDLQRHQLLTPTRVTDADGRVVPGWVADRPNELRFQATKAKSLRATKAA